MSLTHAPDKLALGVRTAAMLLAVLAAGCRTSQPPRRPKLKRITTKTGIDMVLLPAGQFIMGSDAGAPDEKPPRRVRVGAFYMDVYEVTQKAYQALSGMNPGKFKDPNRPVERVSWHAAARYCNLRSLREGLRPCYGRDFRTCDFSADGYRLPTEAEWEYACRAGTSGDYSFRGGASRLGRYAWHKANAAKTTHPVGRKEPNPWGLHDMHGNVSEWCNDHYAEGQLRRAPTANPRGPAGGKERVLRGGNWRATAEACRSAARDSEEPGFADICFGYEAYGFRCVRRAPAR